MAAKELLKARSKFVDMSSDTLVKQLLDDLLEDVILNDGEKDAIIEDQKNKADRARKLIDIVRKKGDGASKKMKARLQNRDPTIYSELFGQFELPGLDQDSAIKPSQPPPPRVKRSNDSSYPVTQTSFKSRVALLISNKVFANSNLNRNGADRDEMNMEKLLKDLGYEVVKHTNLTGKEIDNAFKKFSKHPKLKETDSVFVVVMSHGKLGAVLGVNWKHGDEKPDEFPIDNIYQHLGSQRCPALLNKPKVIIIQACRGEQDGGVLVSDAVACDDVLPPRPSLPADRTDIEDDCVHRAHKEKDFIALLSSTPDTVAYRHKEDGSFLIQYIAEVFSSFSREDDIEELFRKVMQRFEEFSIEDKRQMPTKDRCTITKHFFLFPTQ